MASLPHHLIPPSPSQPAAPKSVLIVISLFSPPEQQIIGLDALNRKEDVYEKRLPGLVSLFTFLLASTSMRKLAAHVVSNSCGHQKLKDDVYLHYTGGLWRRLWKQTI